MGKIRVHNLNIYAYHGCFLEERQIGADYRLDIWVEGDFSRAEKNDQLTSTVDYVSITDIAANEMAVSSKLIEHVADRIVTQILSTWPTVDLVGVTIKKINPPMNVYADSVEYTLERSPNRILK